MVDDKHLNATVHKGLEHTDIDRYNGYPLSTPRLPFFCES